MKEKKLRSSKKGTADGTKGDAEGEGEGSEDTKKSRHINRFREFHNVSTYSGVRLKEACLITGGRLGCSVGLTSIEMTRYVMSK